GSVRRGDQDWRPSYAAQRRHKLAELAQVVRFTNGHACRMLQLVRYFGDQEDSGEPCGKCDICASEACIARRFREPSSREQDVMQRILDVLEDEGDMATGKLYREHFERSGLERRSFEHVLGGLSRSGLVDVRDASFLKDGERIEFQRVSLTGAAGKGGNVRFTMDVGAPKKKKKRKGDKGNTSSDAARRAFFAKRAKKRKKG